MYTDNTLTPKEAARLCALGSLSSEGSLSYANLAASVRHFLDRVQGPSLDIFGTSIELLKYEGLVEVAESEEGEILKITNSGQRELSFLLTAPLRPGVSELNKLIIALKFRFFDLLDQTQQQDQFEIMLETAQTELLRLKELRNHHEVHKGYLVSWLNQEIGELEGRIKWLLNLRII